MKDNDPVKWFDNAVDKIESLDKWFDANQSHIKIGPSGEVIYADPAIELEALIKFGGIKASYITWWLIDNSKNNTI